MTEQEALMHNEKLRFKLLMELLKQIERIEFQTEVGKSLHEDLTVCISEVIRPIIKAKANDLIG